MCGGKAPKQKESEAEKQYAKNAKARLDEWNTDGYKQLEVNAIADAKQDVTGRLTGRANADMEQQIAGAGSVGANSADIEAAGLDATTLAGVKKRTLFDATKDALDYRTGKLINMTKVGANVKGVANQGLASVAGRAIQKGTADLQNKVLLSQARGQMIGDLIGGAAAGYMMKTPTPAPTPRASNPKGGRPHAQTMGMAPVIEYDAPVQFNQRQVIG